ncbi:MAG: CRTAC1 family protein [Pirellulales bacterium]
MKNCLNHRLIGVKMLVMLVAVIGCDTKPSKTSNTTVIDESFKFTDITDKVQLNSVYDNGEDAGELSILETIGGGVGVLDFDCDGFQDFYFAQGGNLTNRQVTGLGGKLLRNNLNKSFQEVTANSRTACDKIYSHGISSGDFNNDGFPDLLVTGYYDIALFINQGDGTFVENSRVAGMNSPSWGTSSALGDFDGDGCLDIYIAHYVNWSFQNHPACQNKGKDDVFTPGLFEGLSDIIYLNNMDGTFSPKSTEIGLVQEGKGLGVVTADFDLDGRIDIYVANDTTYNFYYKNLGGSFEEIGQKNATASDDQGTPQGSMGLCVFDYNKDLHPDLFVCNYENQSFGLYRYDEDSYFRHSTTSAGLTALGTMFVAWGTVARDFDLDGDEDIIISNGHVMRTSTAEQPPLALLNNGQSKFKRLTFADDSYFTKLWRGRGVVAFDFDFDGDQDLLFTHIKSNVALLQNETKISGRWWKLDLIGTKSNRNGIGASIIIESTSNKFFRSIVGGGSYLSQNPYTVHWGLPSNESVVQVTILWPSGTQQVLKEIPHGSSLVVVEP